LLDAGVDFGVIGEEDASYEVSADLMAGHSLLDEISNAILIVGGHLEHDRLLKIGKPIEYLRYLVEDLLYCQRTVGYPLILSLEISQGLMPDGHSLE
jgi:hypothetical protein